MRLTKLSICFVCIFLGFFIPLLINNYTENYAHVTEKQYSHHIEAACEAAMLTASSSNKSLWASLPTRLKATDTFFVTLNSAMNRRGDYAIETKLYVPVICFVDYDGFYICYNAGLDDNATTDDSVYDINEHTPIQQWTETTTNYTIRYYLTDQIMVTHNNTGVSCKGSPSDVYNKFNDIELTFLLSSEIESRKNIKIIDTIKNTLEYYINTQNNYADPYFTQYNIDMSYSEGNEWARMLKNPCIISFIQGKQPKVRNTEIINIYGFSGHELITAPIKDTENNTVR